MDSILNRFRDKFFEEANNLLNQLECDLLELEKSSNDKELIESVFRAMHTIKGISGMYGFTYIADITHSMESIYQEVRDGHLQFNRDIFDVTFQTIDHIRNLLVDEKFEKSQNKIDHQNIENKLVKILGKVTETSIVSDNSSKLYNIFNDEYSSWQIILRTDEQMFFRGINLGAIFSDLSLLGTYQIRQLDFLSNSKSDAWNIILLTKATQDEIHDVFIFIDDYCTFTKIAEFDIFDNENQIKILKEPEFKEVSILNYIDTMHLDTNENSESFKKAEIVTPIADVKVSANNETQIKRISVDATKLDNLMYLVSELITVNSQLILTTKNKYYKDIRKQIEKVDNLSKLFRNNALEIRLIPLSDIVLRFQRLIRDLSKQLEKKINFVTQNIDTELDKNTIDQLHEPLMHIIRNSIDHGIEMPAERVAKGKPEAGTIKISAYNSGNYVFIRIEDDGAGINSEKVRQKAIDKGIVKVTDKLSQQEIFKFIFQPGFSTAQIVTDVSGRGVGMDVVRRKIQDLRGDIEIESTEGVGTAFVLKLQQSIAIIDTLLFMVDEQYFSVPLSEIEICRQMSYDEILKRKHTGTLSFNDNLIPFVDTRAIFDCKGNYPSKLRVIIINNNQTYFALLVDKIIGEHQAVNKPLGNSFHNQKIINSASQLGDGNLVFMIDTKEIHKTIKDKQLTINN